MIHDVIIIWWWAAWLFAGMNLDKSLSKLILEKTGKLWMKVLLSWGERANVSNMNIDTEQDYFTQNNKFLLSVYSKFNQWDTMWFFAENWINIIEEDRWRLILESGKSKELVDLLLKWIKRNKCDFKLEQDVVDIIKWENYEIITKSWIKYKAKNVIVSTWWKSFFQVWTTGEWYSIAQKLWINVITPYRTLCGMSTRRNLSEISWSSCKVEITLKDQNINPSPLRGTSLKSKGRRNPIIYVEIGPILFAHFWVTGPCIHNISNVIWRYLNYNKIKEEEFENYILENLSIDIKFNLEDVPKKVIKFFELDEENYNINLELQNWRSWKEAKATGWWIDTLELDNHMQSKKYKWLYFIWEVVDVTWKTGGFNLQRAWSSAFVACENIDTI